LFYLQHGHPYEVVEGEIKTPNPTAVAAIVDNKFSLQQGNWLKLKKDLPGDPDLRATWAQAIQDLKPQGIIYIVDGRLDDASLQSEVHLIRENVLSHYVSSLRDLQTLHIFINFSDVWGNSPNLLRKKITLVTKAFEESIEDNLALQHLRIGVACTQLSPHKKKWEETKRALHKFGADLLN
jgi:hypothetical protein